ncbi:MAG: cytochrome c [Gemmatimonadota bacterium]
MQLRFLAAFSAVALSSFASDAAVRVALAAPAQPRASTHVDVARLYDRSHRGRGHAPETGEEIFRATCAGCHAADGKGAPKSTVAFAVPVPDFTDCKATTPESTVDYTAVIRDGGSVRGFSRIMPAFRDLLTPEQIHRVVTYMRTLCPEPSWPRGELNVSLALVTEKAFPEDEVVLSSTVSTRGPASIENHFILEKRFGKRAQLEVDVPYGFVERPGKSWVGGLGDASIAAKRVLYSSSGTSGTILSGLAGVVLPTADARAGLGTGTTSFEAIVLGAKLLPARSFFQFEGGVNLPTDVSSAPRSAFWSGALGKTVAFSSITRIWSPAIEVAGSRDLVRGAPVDWSVVPQFQLSLSALQHVRAGFGVNIPITQRKARDSQIMAYLLWDTADGPLLQGWKGRCTGCEH